MNGSGLDLLQRRLGLAQLLGGIDLYLDVAIGIGGDLVGKFGDLGVRVPSVTTLLPMDVSREALGRGPFAWKWIE